MDTPHTVPMSTFFEGVKILHLESTNVCQAACPLCLRETDPIFDKDEQNFLTPEFLLDKILNEDVIKQLDKMYMCGVYGDPAANKYSLDIFSLFKKINSNITLGMNTNGALQNTTWWSKLAGILNSDKDYVVFSIDGLEDTNHIYRRNVKWPKLMENVKSFINSGGNAHWDMLVFDHNEHQVDQCETMAKQLGFKYFRVKVSKRKHDSVNWIKPPREWKNPSQLGNTIDCVRNKEKSIYIDAKGSVYPCCWLGQTDFTIDKFNSIQKTWNTTDCNNFCKNNCSVLQNTNSFQRQWQREISFV